MAMELLAEISEADFGARQDRLVEYSIRKAARAVLFDQDHRVALLALQKPGLHKVPGGILRPGETAEHGLKREVMESTGFAIKIGEPLGAVIEYRDAYRKMQISYCYIAHTMGKSKGSHFTKEDVDQGAKLVWMPLDEAIHTISREKPPIPEGKYIVRRELILLKRAKEMKYR